MRIFILTCLDQGDASLCLPALARLPDVELVAACACVPSKTSRRKLLLRKLKKAFRIGLLGALNGIRMRSWYRYDTPSFRELAQRYHVPYIELVGLKLSETLEKIRSLNCDLGLSLGNGYIPPCFFELPRFGMINLHTEVLPRFQGAQGIIWPIYEGVKETGATVHQIDRGIDTGIILKQLRIPIEFKKTLRETVIYNNEQVHRRAVQLVVDVVAHYQEIRAGAKPQSAGGKYTTPTFWQFLRMVLHHRQFRHQLEMKTRHA